MQVEIVPIDSVHLDPANARLHDDKNLSAIKGSLARFKQQKPLVVTEDNVIRAGNATWRAAKDLGWKDIAVVRTTLKGAEAMAYALADNRTAELATWDMEVLNADISGLVEEGWTDLDLGKLGLGTEDLSDLLAAIGEKDGTNGAGGDPAGTLETEESKPIPALPENARILQGDVLEVLKTLPASSVHCVVTSPPYWGLRDYGTGTWEGGDAACDHKKSSRQGTTGQCANPSHTNDGVVDFYNDTCERCGATRIDRQIGLESTPEEFIAKLVAVFREVRRVLHPSGTCWINMGDSFASTTKGSGGASEKQDSNAGSRYGATKFELGSLKPKDLVGQPWALAFALRADGWYLRSDIIWHKPNPMPESVTDRPTKSHEYVFLLTKSEKYFYDAEAVREPFADERMGNPGGGGNYMRELYPESPHAQSGLKKGEWTKGESQGGRNLRDVWTIATEAYAEAHFATYPRKLVTPCVKAGSSAKGVCPKCMAPWERVVELGEITSTGGGYIERLGSTKKLGIDKATIAREHHTTGWRPTCSCASADPVPATVLDPFCGSGTTGLVALNHGRKFVGIELNPKYIDLAKRRIFDGYELPIADKMI